MATDSRAAPADILDILLRAEPETADPGLPDLDRLLRRAVACEAGPTATPPRPRLVRSAPARPGDATGKKPKIKTTHYLAPDTHARLARVRDRLADSTGPAHGRRLSKSRVVETAVRQALDEFEARGPDSRLARALETVTDEA